MLTLDSLRAFGADVTEGLGRCMNNEAFYLRMVRMVYADKNFDLRREAAASGDVRQGFEAAHALKGILGNLSLKNMYVLADDLTELLRPGEEVDFRPQAEEILRLHEALRALDN